MWSPLPLQYLDSLQKLQDSTVLYYYYYQSKLRLCVGRVEYLFSFLLTNRRERQKERRGSDACILDVYLCKRRLLFIALATSFHHSSSPLEKSWPSLLSWLVLLLFHFKGPGICWWGGRKCCRRWWCSVIHTHADIIADVEKESRYVQQQSREWCAVRKQ